MRVQCSISSASNKESEPVDNYLSIATYLPIIYLICCNELAYTIIPGTWPSKPQVPGAGSQAEKEKQEKARTS